MTCFYGHVTIALMQTTFIFKETVLLATGTDGRDGKILLCFYQIYPLKKGLNAVPNVPKIVHAV